MKMKDAHIVPLSTQAIALLRDIHPLTGNQRYVFASNQGKNGENISAENQSAQLSGAWATKASTLRMDSEPPPAPFYTNTVFIRI